MFWEEKIEFFIKSKKLTTKDLSIPYTFWSEVFKEIEKHFLIKTDAKYTYQNWENRLKNKHIINVEDYKQRIKNDKKILGDFNKWNSIGYKSFVRLQWVFYRRNYPTSR